MTRQFVFGVMALFSVNAILAADNTENIGTWYEHDTLYVFSIKVPDHATLTSMKLQLKNSRGSFRTVGSPRIQIIPQEVLGKEIVFTRSRHIINADIGSPKQPLEFRLAFYETGLDLYQYGLVTQTAKPAQHYDLELVAESSYPLEKDALVDTAQIVTSTQADLRPTTVSKPQNSETITQPQTVNQDTTSSLRQVPASIEETTSVDPTKTDTCECNDDSTRAIQSKVTKKASTDSTLAATAGTENPKKQVAKPKNPPDGKSKTTSPSNQPKVKRPPVPSKAPRGTIFDQGILNGIVLEASMASPYWVSKNLTTWYSSIDWRISFTTPFYYKLGPMMVGFTIELSGFDFENTFPEGGRFNGQAMLGYLTGYWRGLNMELGGGSFAGTSGMITGLSGKILEGSHLYLSGGVRGVLIQDINPIGLAQWAEGRLTLGYKF
ncbi:MAG: hypothetical protein AUJ47_08265 [Candidatus Marinimicrobia bacterium CG1_02_48_14]|nr:MAG: hypothetical protein AUJ47_08265 [Candidatus Marinimicrobia bacterium CG1_02_48_14]